VLVGLWLTIGVALVPYSILTFVVSGGYMLVLLRTVGAQLGANAVGGPIRREHLHSVGTYSAGLTGMAVQNDGDKIALKVYGWGEDAGRYRAAYSLVQMGLLPVTALIGATHVSFLHQGDDASQLQRARRLASISVVYGLVVAAGLWAFAPLVPKMLSDFDGTPSIIRWLSPLVLLRGTGTFAMNGLLGLGYNRLRTMLLVGNAVVTTGLYAALVRSHSWRGAVAATLISELLLFLAAWVCLIVLQRKHDQRGPVDKELVSAGLQAEADVLYGEKA
jgi:O-antigen/teichoic acid export membrane protein